MSDVRAQEDPSLALDIPVWELALHLVDIQVELQVLAHHLERLFGAMMPEYHAEIAELRTMSYREYLRTPDWQELSRLLRKRRHCQLCGLDTTDLHVHHNSYKRRGLENPGDLIVLCADCHAKHHGKAP